MTRSIVALLSVLGFASAASAQIPDEPIKWTLTLPSTTATTTPGGKITLSLNATIEDGWHLYAITLPAGGPIATVITVPTGQKFTLGGDIEEPSPKSSFDANFNMTLDYYESKATFGIPLKVSTDSGYGDLPARVAVSFQTCNDQFCLPPKQVVTTVQVKVVPGGAAPAPVPADRDAFNKALQVKDLDAQIVAVEKYIVDFPDSDTLYFAAARVMRNIGDADQADTTRLAAFVRAAEQSMDAAAVKGTARTYQQADLYYNMASRLVARNVLIDDALRLARKSVERLNATAKNDFMARELATHNERQKLAAARTPGHIDEPFPRAESEERWTGIEASQLSALGKALLAKGLKAEAETRLKQSYALTPVLETALGLATLAEQSGRLDEALKYAVAGELTGRMGAERTYLEDIYKKTHNGSLDGLTAMLDAAYRAKHTNPISTTPYAPTPSRTNRTVLAELFTGAACIPCVSVDLSFERELERYSRTELALLVYHIHAPTSDPFSNFAVEARSGYYGVHAAPTVLLDGVMAPIGEGGGPLATAIFPKLDAAINTRLETRAVGQLAATTSRKGNMVSVSINVTDTKGLGQNVRVHAALVENEAAYSGENGLRVQPMVVREMMGSDTNRGTLVAQLTDHAALWEVDLSKLEALNLTYYDWYIADLKKRANIDATFREKRPRLDASRLSFVVFLQDDVTHEFLQSAFVPVR